MEVVNKLYLFGIVFLIVFLINSPHEVKADESCEICTDESCYVCTHPSCVTGWPCYKDCGYPDVCSNWNAQGCGCCKYYCTDSYTITCSGDTPYCLEDTDEYVVYGANPCEFTTYGDYCVECLEDSHCDGTSSSCYCSGNFCQACGANEICKKGVFDNYYCCKPSGQSCTETSDCCALLVCTDGTCQSLSNTSTSTTITTTIPQECSNYTNQGDCEGDGSCDWCAECSGKKQNQWEEEKCVDAGTNCGYSCKPPECGANCDSNDDCGSDEECLDCECQSNCGQCTLSVGLDYLCQSCHGHCCGSWPCYEGCYGTYWDCCDWDPWKCYNAYTINASDSFSYVFHAYKQGPCLDRNFRYFWAQRTKDENGTDVSEDPQLLTSGSLPGTSWNKCDMDTFSCMGITGDKTTVPGTFEYWILGVASSYNNPDAFKDCWDCDCAENQGYDIVCKKSNTRTQTRLSTTSTSTTSTSTSSTSTTSTTTTSIILEGCQWIDISMIGEISTETNIWQPITVTLTNNDVVDSHAVEIYVMNKDEMDNGFGRLEYGAWDYYFEDDTCDGLTPTETKWIDGILRTIEGVVVVNSDSSCDMEFSFRVPAGYPPGESVSILIGVRDPGETGDCPEP